MASVTAPMNEPKTVSLNSHNSFAGIHLGGRIGRTQKSKKGWPPMVFNYHFFFEHNLQAQTIFESIAVGGGLYVSTFFK